MRFLQLLLVLLLVSASQSTKVTVHHVVDGDTIDVVFQGKVQRVRLIGVNTPESYNGVQAYKEAKRKGKDLAVILAMGKKAAEFTKVLLSTQEYVHLEFDVQERDRFGRLLAYVYLMNGQMLNEFLILEGMAEVMTVPPNVRYAEKFKEAELQARYNKRGFWHE